MTLRPSSIPVYAIPARESLERRLHRAAVVFTLRGTAKPARNVGALVFGALISVVFHSLLLGWGLRGLSSTQTKRPENTGLGASATDSHLQPVLTMILIADPQVSSRQPKSRELPSRGFAPEDLKIRVFSPNAYPAIDLSRATGSAQIEAPEIADAIERAAAFGRYMSQVNARIKRAWVRPAAPTETGLFQCTVNIEQDRQGYVQAVKLLDCNGNSYWQQSLVDAIRSASPLPSPPDPQVFSATLSSQFESRTQAVERSPVGYEPTPEANNAIDTVEQ